MILGVTFTNGLVFGFEFSMKTKIFQIHVGFMSLVAVFGLDKEGEPTYGADQ